MYQCNGIDDKRKHDQIRVMWVIIGAHQRARRPLLRHVLHRRGTTAATSATKRSERPLIVFLPLLFYTSQGKPHSWWLDAAAHRHSQRPDETPSWVNMWGVPAPPAYLPRVDQSFLFFGKFRVCVLGCDCGSLFFCLWLLCVFMFVRMHFFFFFLRMEEEAFVCLDAIACLFVC